MAALTDLSDCINLSTGGGAGAPEDIFFYRDSRVDAAAAVATVAGRITSLWQYEGYPSGGAAPTSVAVPDNTTVGGMLQTDPGGGRQKWLLGMTATSSAAGTLLLYDRLLHIGGLSGTVTTAQTVGGTLTRNTGGAGNQIWVEVYTIIGTTGVNITASYTDQDGNTGQTTTATTIGGTGLREAQRIIPLPLASGDSGVQAVASVTLAASTTTAGNFGVSIIKPIAIVPIGLLGAGSIRDFIAGIPSIPEIDTDACLGLAWLANGTSAPQVTGSLHFVEK